MGESMNRPRSVSFSIQSKMLKSYPFTRSAHRLIACAPICQVSAAAASHARSRVESRKLASGATRADRVQPSQSASATASLPERKRDGLSARW